MLVPPRGMRAAVLATSLACAAVSATVVLPAQPHAGYRSSAVHVALDTAASLIALLTAFLVAGRFRRCALLREVMLVCALTVLAISDLFFGTLPVLAGSDNTALAAWASLAGSMLGALLFALAAYLPGAKPRSAGLGLTAGAAAALAALAFAALAALVFAALAFAVVLIGSFTVPQVMMAVLYGLAAVGFLVRREQFGEEFAGWLAIAAVLATASRIDYSLYPALDSDSVYLGEAFRLLFYAVLLAGSMREIWSHSRALSEAAVRQERRRVARDLHDGVIQELAYLARNLDLLAAGTNVAAGTNLAAGTNVETVERLRRAVERAQAESRRAIYALTAPAAGQTVETMVAEAVSKIAERFNVELAFDSVSGVRLSEPRAEALVRIACEALTNAARHSGTSLVRLTLTRDGQRVRLRVSDDGCGFNPDSTGGGFGLIAIRERARSVGGELRITSAPGAGSEVEAVL